MFVISHVSEERPALAHLLLHDPAVTTAAAAAVAAAAAATAAGKASAASAAAAKGKSFKLNISSNGGALHSKAGGRAAAAAAALLDDELSSLPAIENGDEDYDLKKREPLYSCAHAARMWELSVRQVKSSRVESVMKP